ncbi:6-phospho-3-hexuloisomerase [Bifidobacterium oedipodis]|uniref:Sugar isomerase n=1 Tax=Bifidobacterium oedipodis TaxID=2675322 RepID=A0A7Y0HSD4_9BIFI|nr:6-phospho-3-hexuloisomerase [Bifidobacterium sp. DSM 109957]NMM92897.1 sugar isomerase [Bifidobacterium sp. DSM 109957]
MTQTLETTATSSFRNCEKIIVSELADVLAHVDEQQIDRLTTMILNARKVFFVGVGRVELALEAIAKRLAHLGVDTVMVGQITEPAICDKDLLIVGSGSGKTGFPLFIAGKAKSFGAKVARIGIVEDCPMTQFTDLFVHVPAAGKPGSGTKPSQQPMTSLFEQSLLLVGDAIAMSLVRERNIDLDSLWEFHANLE